MYANIKEKKNATEMRLYTEKEIIRQTIVNLDYCSLIENDGIVKLDELGELIPGFIHINNLKNHGLEYVSKRGLDIFEKTIDEIREEGREFLIKISDYKSLTNYIAKNNFLTQNTTKTYSHFQRLRYKERNIPFQLFYTTSKLHKGGKGIVSYTQPLHLLQQDSFLKEVVENRFVFFNSNYEKFQLLTPREREILKLISLGNSNKTISEKLHISFQTVKTHRKNVCRKLESGKLIDLIQFAQVFINQ